mmetsp:Transcript_4248/g.5998  ORF Transcript_4248/g.5998 Transcript_4248/m.5998 type:complete len:195 (-) Transcript_4248:2815-3399(-)
MMDANEITRLNAALPSIGLVLAESYSKLPDIVSAQVAKVDKGCIGVTIQHKTNDKLVTTSVQIPWTEKKRSLEETRKDLIILYRSSLRPRADLIPALIFLFLLFIFFNILANFGWCQPIRQFALYILRTEFMLWFLLFLTVCIHIAEATIAFFLARHLRLEFSTTIGWTLLTFLVGAASLRPLARFAGIQPFRS